MKSKYFNNRIAPACEYCEYGRSASDFKMILCKHKGVVSPYFRCRRFKYSPVKRIPRAMPAIPRKDPEDFSL